MSDARDDETEDRVDVEEDEGLGPGEVDLSEEGELVREGPGLVGTAELAPDDLKGALESLILVSDKPIAAVRLARLTRQDVGVVRKALAELQDAYGERGIVLDEIAGGFQFRTSPRFAPFVRMLIQQKPTKLSRAQLEVLSIIAYRQPVTRPEVDDVRGVDSGSALKLLLERNLIKIIGKKDDAGRPMLYATTTDFLELFGLKNLRDLPTLREFAELTQESRDIFERRIGEPLPGQGEGMDLATHYEAQAGGDGDGSDDDEPADGAAPGESDGAVEGEPSTATEDVWTEVPDESADDPARDDG